MKKAGGPDISSYRKGVIQRRITLRARVMGAESLPDYIEMLKGDPGELETLKKALTIKVTTFFRNPETFDALRRKVLPLVFSNAAEEGRRDISIVSLGCATGEEVYSVAIILRRYFSAQMGGAKVKVKGFDIDEECLEYARIGSYEAEKLKMLDARTVKVGFKKEPDGKYMVRDELKNMVSFSYADMMEPEGIPISDIVLTRNTLIYFPKDKQMELIKKLGSAIRPRGFLVLGKTETVPVALRDKFKPFSIKEKIFRKAD